MCRLEIYCTYRCDAVKISLTGIILDRQWIDKVFSVSLFSRTSNQNENFHFL